MAADSDLIQICTETADNIANWVRDFGVTELDCKHALESCLENCRYARTLIEYAVVIMIARGV